MRTEPLHANFAATPSRIQSAGVPGTDIRRGHAPFLPREALLLVACLILLSVALVGPYISQPAGYHAFADQRPIFGIEHGWDVMSNLPFALFGLYGLWRTARRDILGALPPAQRLQYGLFFGGLVLTAMCSSWYHLAPNDSALAVDRFGMLFAFSGVLGSAATEHISDRAGAWLAAAVLGLGFASVVEWSVTGNVLSWGILQFGGMLLLVAFAWLMPRTDATLRTSWAWVIGIYAVAKLLEATDASVYAWTGHLVSGHSLKHVVASAAAVPLILALRRVAQRQV